MDDNAHISQENEATLIVHDELSIILNASSFDPAHINPDFLRYNQIVDSDWQIDYPVIIETGLSSISYENGLTLTAMNDSLTFSQTGSSLALAEITAPDVARRYLERAPWYVEYNAIHTNLRGSINVPGEGFAMSISPLRRLAMQARFRGITPNPQTRLSYRSTDKRITIYFSESVSGGLISRVNFTARLHRDVDDELSPSVKTEFIDSSIKQWQADIDEIESLATQFYSIYKED